MTKNNSLNAPISFSVPNGGTGDASFTAYSVLCGGTTSTGALQNVSGVGSSGQVLTSNGASALPTWQAAPSAGNFVFITSATASSSASLAFTSVFSGTYQYYYIIFNGVLPATTSVNFQYTLSVDGVTYNSSGYNYSLYLNGVAIGGGSGPFGSSSGTTAILTSTTASYQVSNLTANGGVSGTLVLVNPNSATVGTLGYSSLGYGSNTSGYYAAATNGVSGLSAQANTAIKFSFSSGNMASGTIAIYGLTL